MLQEDNRVEVLATPTILAANQQPARIFVSVSSSNILATVIAKDNLAVAIGGLIKTSLATNVKKIPLLGDIPYLGVFFRRESEIKTKTELVLIIIPHIIKTPEQSFKKTMPLVQELSDHLYFKEGDKGFDSQFKRSSTEFHQGP